MALNTLEEIFLRERNALKVLILRETNRLTVGKKPVNFKISNFVRKYKEDKDVWSKFLDSISAEDLSRSINVYEYKFSLSRENSIVRRYLRLNSASRDVLKNFQVTLDSKMSGGPQVTVAQGELLGRTATTASGFTYYSFQGVPYAQPPIGSLRFKAPQYPKPWTGVKDATSPGPKCAQMDPYRHKKFEGSEDCLYLNVYTPKLPSDEYKKYPVIVYVHGGRYQAGYGSYWLPDYLIEREVILVTINYRLNVLGFLALGLPECPGNASMKDVVFALRWIKENVRKFNGDPDNVTVFGESAGAGTVSCLLTTPMAEGLFHKMILESGTFVHDIFLMKEDTVAKARKIAKMLGSNISDPKELFEFLQSVEVEKLVEANCDIMRNKIDPRAFFSPVEEPVFEGVENFFPEDPTKCLKEGRYRKVPMIVGSNSHEGGLFVMQDKDGSVFYIQDLTLFIPRSFYADRNSAKCEEFAHDVKQFYFGDKPIDDTTKSEFLQMISDVTFDRDNFRFMDYALDHQTNIWSFKFSYMGSLNAPVIKNLGLKGASHSDQLPYQFKRPKINVDLTDDDKRIISFFSESWSNFAKNGNPNATAAGVDWLPMTKDNRYCLSIDNRFELLTFPDKERMEFWKEMYEKYGKTMSKI